MKTDKNVRNVGAEYLYAGESHTQKKAYDIHSKVKVLKSRILIFILFFIFF